MVRLEIAFKITIFAFCATALDLLNPEMRHWSLLGLWAGFLVAELAIWFLFRGVKS